MGAMKDLMIDLMNKDADVYKFGYGFTGYPRFSISSRDELEKLTELTNNNKTKLDLPYLDLSKLTSYVEEGYLYIKYNNPDDTRRKTYNYTQYVGNAEVKIKYENGFLFIEREEKKPERKFVNVSSK